MIHDKKKFALTTISFIILLMAFFANPLTLITRGMIASTLDVRFEPEQAENQTSYAAPALRLIKEIEKDRISPGENITIILEITNNGNSTAYNVSIEEPEYPEWSIVKARYATLKFAEIRVNATTRLNYTLQVLKEGEYTIESTIATFEDENGTSYTSYSNTVKLVVSYLPPPPSYFFEWSMTLLLMLSVFVIIIGTKFLRNWLISERGKGRSTSSKKK